MSEELINEWLKNNKPTQLNSSEKSGLANNNEYQVFKGKYKGSYRDKDGEWHVFSNVTSNTSKRKFSKNQSFKTKKTFKKNKIYQFEGYFSKAKEKERRRLPNAEPQDGLFHFSILFYLRPISYGSNCNILKSRYSMKRQSLPQINNFSDHVYEGRALL